MQRLQSNPQPIQKLERQILLIPSLENFPKVSLFFSVSVSSSIILFVSVFPFLQVTVKL